MLANSGYSSSPAIFLGTTPLWLHGWQPSTTGRLPPLLICVAFTARTSTGPLTRYLRRTSVSQECSTTSTSSFTEGGMPPSSALYPRYPARALQRDFTTARRYPAGESNSRDLNIHLERTTSPERGFPQVKRPQPTEESLRHALPCTARAVLRWPHTACHLLSLSLSLTLSHTTKLTLRFLDWLLVPPSAGGSSLRNMRRMTMAVKYSLADLSRSG